MNIRKAHFASYLNFEGPLSLTSEPFLLYRGTIVNVIHWEKQWSTCQHIFPPSLIHREKNVFKLEIDGTHMQLSISMTLNPLPPTRISSYLNKVGHANIKWKGSKCFLAHKHACSKSFFFSQYSLHYSPRIFHFEGRGWLGRVESGNNRVCTIFKDKVGFSPVSLPCSYTGYLLWLMQQPHPPHPPKILFVLLLLVKV